MEVTKMNIQIKETGEIKSLTIRDDNNIDWTADLITSARFDHNDDGDPIMTQADYEWWKNYINEHEQTESDIEVLAEELEDSGIERQFDGGWEMTWLSYINYRIQQNAGNDYECHRREAVEVMNEIREEFLKEK
jgi:hypothetical protein